MGVRLNPLTGELELTPVDSVNGQTGAVDLKLTDLTNYIDYSIDPVNNPGNYVFMAVGADADGKIQGGFLQPNFVLTVNGLGGENIMITGRDIDFSDVYIDWFADVNTSLVAPVLGDVLTWDSTNGWWYPAAPPTTLPSLNISTPTIPATASSAGTAGDISWDSNFIYVCVATNTWKRVGIATW